MNLKNFAILCLLAVALGTRAQTDLRAFAIYDNNGNPTSFQAMTDALNTADVVFLGEMHNCPITHWLELKTVEALWQKSPAGLKVGMEMFEADNQLIIDEYLARTISSDRFEAECRLWPNYSTDYAPVVDFLYEHQIPLVATNVPRRYANVVKGHGLTALDSLSTEAKRYIAPLPIAYENNENANAAFSLMSAMGKRSNPEFMGQAQAVKDATMAWFIARTLNHKTIHINGNYHSDTNGGIITYLKKYKPGITIKTVYSVKQESIDALEDDYKNRADFYVVVPQDMVTSY